MALTIFLAGSMRFLLPDGSEKYWLASGLVAALGGFLGDLVMTAVRRDAGMKTVGPFILGRGDFLHRVDRLIFVAPIYYYVMTVLL
jgi:phosphatidate cytidylyltransferase